MCYLRGLQNQWKDNGINTTLPQSSKETLRTQLQMFSSVYVLIYVKIKQFYLISKLFRIYF